jgi:hypothetical protein
MVGESEDSIYNETLEGLNSWLKSAIRESGIYHGVVKDVDLTDYTCTIVFREEDIDKDSPAGFSGVQLNVIKPCTINGKEYKKATIVEVPMEGSYCLFGFISNNMLRPILLYCQHIEQVLWEIDDSKLTYDTNGFKLEKGNLSIEVNDSEIKFNGGTNNGMVLISELITKLNNLEHAFNAHVHVCSAPSSPSLPPTAVPNLIPIIPTIQTDIENTKILQ